MDYVIIPDWFTNDNIKNSKILRHFFSENNINTQKIDLNIFRQYYKKDKLKFFSIIDEMGLRGFDFSSNKSNNLLPKIKISKETLFINCLQDSKKYEKIDFERIGIANFINRYLVKSDIFFNNIPIDGFLYLNNN